MNFLNFSLKVDFWGCPWIWLLQKSWAYTYRGSLCVDRGWRWSLKNSTFYGGKIEFKLVPNIGDIYACSRKKSKNGVGEFTPLHSDKMAHKKMPTKNSRWQHATTLTLTLTYFVPWYFVVGILSRSILTLWHFVDTPIHTVMKKNNGRPFGTGCRFVMSLGDQLPTALPISDEKVSPQLHDSAPSTAATSHEAVGCCWKSTAYSPQPVFTMKISASSAATPPLHTTCFQSRCPPVHVNRITHHMTILTTFILPVTKFKIHHSRIHLSACWQFSPIHVRQMDWC